MSAGTLLAVTCYACAGRIADTEPAALCDRGFFHHEACLPAPADLWTARDRELVALRLSSPKRAEPGRVLVAQADVAHLPLFVAADEPVLL